MRINYKVHEPVSGDSDPRKLHSSDIQAFGAVRDYLQALRTNQEHKAKAILDANEDLTAYFNFSRREWQKNPYFCI